MDDLVQLLYPFVRLCGARVLLRARRGYLLYQLGRLPDIRHQLGQQLPGALGHAHALGRQPVDLRRRRLAAFGQLPYLARHNREALAVLPGARRLHRRVQRQQVGLSGDLFNNADLLGNLFHRQDGLLHRLATAAGVLGRLRGDLIGLLGVIGILLNARRHLFHR